MGAYNYNHNFYYFITIFDFYLFVRLASAVWLMPVVSVDLKIYC